MKKTYITPNTVIVKTELKATILTGSDPLAGIDKENAGSNPGDFESRQNNMWDIWGEGMDDDFDE